MIERCLKRWTVPLLGCTIVVLALLIGACGTPAPEPTAPPPEVPTEAPTAAPTEAPENNPPLVRIKILGTLEGVEDEEGELIMTSALPNVGVGTHVFLEEVVSDPDEGDSVTTEWAFTPPDGSSAELTEGGSAYFVADVEGKYEVKLVATDTAGASSEATLTVNAATYMGQENCAMCHADQAEKQAETDHASMFARGIDGIVSDHYGEGCIGCHTVAPWEGENAAFDDVMAEVGWAFPETLEEGNWEALQADYAELAALGNIQCENCHGPGSAHMGDPEGIAVSLAAETCGYCHDAPTHHVKNFHWRLAGRSDEESRARSHILSLKGMRAACRVTRARASSTSPRATTTGMERWRASETRCRVCWICSSRPSRTKA